MASLDKNPYIVRYYHSWFERHSYKWQKTIDKELLTKPIEGFNDQLELMSASNTDSQMITNTVSTKLNFNSVSDNTSSSFIVFEKAEDDDEDDNQNDKIDSEVEEVPDRYALYMYIQMELCQRETLRHWLDKFTFEKRSHLQIFTIFDQILNAISYIHSKKLIHRDLKVLKFKCL